MDKNSYFYAFEDALTRSVDERSLKRNKLAVVNFFQSNWEKSIGVLTGAELAERAITEFSLKRRAF